MTKVRAAKPGTDGASADKPKTKSNIGTIVGFSVLGCICVPFFYYTLTLHFYGT